MTQKYLPELVQVEKHKKWNQLNRTVHFLSGGECRLAKKFVAQAKLASA